MSTLRGSAIVSKLRGVGGAFFSTADRYWGGPVARFTVYAEISEQGVCGRGEGQLFFGGTWQPLRVAVDEDSKTEHPNRLLKRMSVL